MQEIAKNYVLKYYKTLGVELTEADVFVVWFCKTLQNWKCILGTTNKDELLFEVSHNGDTKETYIDVYDKKENIVAMDDNYWDVRFRKEMEK